MVFFGKLLLSLTLTTRAASHRSLHPGVTCGSQFNSSATALVIPNPKISWASYRILTCDAPIFWLSAEVVEVGQSLEFTALVPLVERFESVRISVVIIGPGLPVLGATAAVPAEVSAAVQEGEGAVLFESPADQSTCGHLASAEMNDSSNVYGGRCHFHEPYGDSRMWVLLDQALKAAAVGIHRIAIFTSTKTTAKISFACCDWPEDFTTRFPIPEANCPYCGTKESFTGYSSLFFEKEAMAAHSGFPALQDCDADPSAPVAPTGDQCPDERPPESGGVLPTQPESCRLGCVGEECHSHNIFGACTYAMEWITPKPKLYNINVTKMILFKGDTVRFSSTGHFWPHNLAIMPSAQHLTSCNWTGAEQVLTVEEVRKGKAITFSQAGTFYYSCQMTGHCEMGQKLVVEVKDSSEGMQCHDDGGGSAPADQSKHVGSTGNASCPGDTVSAYILESAAYGATEGQCSQMCTSAAAVQWITGAKLGGCADEGFVQFVSETTVKPAGSPMDVQVTIKTKPCPSGQVSAYILESEAYGAKNGECSEMCTSAAAIQWMTDVKQGMCADEGFVQMIGEKTVKPAGSPQDVAVKIMTQEKVSSCHCHSYERISCAVADALYEEHILEIQEHCATILDGSESVCPYKCYQPFEVLHLHYLECTERPKHSTYSAVEQTRKCHIAAEAPYGTDCGKVPSTSHDGSHNGHDHSDVADVTTTADANNADGHSHDGHDHSHPPTNMTTLASTQIDAASNTHPKSAGVLSVAALAFATCVATL